MTVKLISYRSGSATKEQQELNQQLDGKQETIQRRVVFSASLVQLKAI